MMHAAELHVHPLLASQASWHYADSSIVQVMQHLQQLQLHAIL